MKSNYLSRAQAAFVLLMLLFTFSLGLKANSVDVERARQVAKTFLNNNGAQSRGLRDVSTDAGFSNLYVFTTANSFVLIAADDCVQPILGYSLTGSFITENMPENIRWWLQSYSDQIQYAIDRASSPTQEVIRQWQELANGTTTNNRLRTVVGPLIATTWNQGCYYNALCPEDEAGECGHVWTGCVATAMAQIMKYWNYPAHGIGWHSYTLHFHPEYGEQTANFNATNYDWNNMMDYYEYYYDEQGNWHWDDTQTDEQRQAVATLMYHIGVSKNMSYDPSGSGTSSDITHALYYYFNYSSTKVNRDNYNDSEWITIIRNEINASRPVFYCGNGIGSHAFVCDGYDSDTYNNYFFHFNWGWGGDCNGYYSIDNMTPSDYDFSFSQDATIGIQPSTNNADPTNLTYTLNGRNVTLHWTSASGAVSYNIYRDMFYVGNVTTNSFTEIAPYGTSVYYVRSVDNNDVLSLSSNSVSVSVAYQIPEVSDLSATVLGDDVNLSWTAPEWCYPQTPTATLTYGEGPGEQCGGYNTSYFYAHRFLAADLAQYANKSIYKVETGVSNAQQSTIYIYIYTNTLNDNPDPNSLATTVMQTFSYPGAEGFLYLANIDLPDPVVISGTTDLWIVINQVVTDSWGGDFSGYVLPLRIIDTYNPNACYYGTSQILLTPFPHNGGESGPSWPINTYLTDGTYSYNIYRNGTNITNNVSNTSYSDNNLPNGSYTYYIKTNYYAGESAASNSVTAQVEVTWYNIGTSCEPTNGGTATGGGTYYNGQSCTLTATPAPGYAFVNWTKNGTQVSTNPNYTFNVDESASYVAHFQLQPYTISITVDPTEGGTVSGGGTFTYGQSCTVHATANTGYSFVNWTENGTQVSTNTDYTFTVTGNRTLIANFQPQSYIITTTVNPMEGGTVSGAGTYNYGQTCTLTATTNQGYTFINWTKNGTQVSSNSTYSFSVTESAIYVAHFQIQDYNISVTADPTEGGTVSGGGVYNYGQTCTLNVTPHENYIFIHWTENDIVVSEEQSFSFTVEGSHSFVAHLLYYDGLSENQDKDINIYPNPVNNTLTVKTSQPVNKWEICNISGAILYIVEKSTDMMEFQVSHFAPGTYLIRLTTNNTVLTRIFVKK